MNDWLRWWFDDNLMCLVQQPQLPRKRHSTNFQITHTSCKRLSYCHVLKPVLWFYVTGVSLWWLRTQVRVFRDRSAVILIEFCFRSYSCKSTRLFNSNICTSWTFCSLITVNILRLRQNGHHFADDIFQCISLDENHFTLVRNSMKFILDGSINSNPALVQIMVWRRKRRRAII